MNRKKKRATDSDYGRLRLFPLPGNGLWIGVMSRGDRQLGVTAPCPEVNDVALDALQRGFDVDSIIQLGEDDEVRGGAQQALAVEALGQSLDDLASSLALDRTERDSATDPEMTHLMSKARDAYNGGRDAWRVQSTGEKLVVALALNRFDWLQSLDYSIAEALDRVGPRWVSLVPSVARALKDRY